MKTLEYIWRVELDLDPYPPYPVSLSVRKANLKGVNFSEILGSSCRNMPRGLEGRPGYGTNLGLNSGSATDWLCGCEQALSPLSVPQFSHL